jgi:hypothetical protein
LEHKLQSEHILKAIKKSIFLDSIYEV